MGDHVIGLEFILIIGLGIADGETAELCLVIEILHFVTRLIDGENGMVHRVIITDALHSHVDIMGRHRLKAAELVARRENEVAVMVVGDMIHRCHHRARNRHGIVLTSVLGNDTDEFAVRVLDLIGLEAHIETYLLKTVVELHIGAGRDCRKDSHCPLTYREACLEEDCRRVILLINAEQVITADQQLHVTVGQRELIIIVVDIGRLALLIIINVGIVEATDILALHQA